MVYDCIKEYLCSGEIKSNEMVSERDMAEKFAVKRGAVREVLIQLEGEGIVNRIPLKGYKLNDFSKESSEEVLEIRRTIEILAAKRAAEHADREDIIRLTLGYEELEKAYHGGNVDEQAEADKNFHRVLVKASKSELLFTIFSFLTLPILPKTSQETKKMRENSCKGHRLILEAVKKHDATLAEKLMEEHFSKQTVWYD